MEQLKERGLTDSYDLLTDREEGVLQLLAEGRSKARVIFVRTSSGVVGYGAASAVRNSAPVARSICFPIASDESVNENADAPQNPAAI